MDQNTIDTTNGGEGSSNDAMKIAETTHTDIEDETNGGEGSSQTIAMKDDSASTKGKEGCIVGDGEMLLVGEAGVLMKITAQQAHICVTLRDIIEDTAGSDCVIPLESIEPDIMAHIIVWLEQYKDETFPTKEGDNDPNIPYCEIPIPDWDMQWIDAIMEQNASDIYAILLAANFLEIQWLLFIIARRIAMILTEMTTEEIRTKFNITNSHTPEEEEKIKKEFAWCSTQK